MKRTLIYLYRQYKYVGYTFKKSRPIGFLNKIKMRIFGFFDSSYLLYDFKNNSNKSYISDYQENVPIQFINGGNKVLENKLYFSEITKVDVSIPKTHGYIFNGSYYPLDDNYNTFISLLENERNLFLKQIDGDGGLGIYKISINGDSFNTNGKETSESDIMDLIGSLDSYMLSEIISQDSYSDKLFSNTVNTIRMLTMVNPKTGIPFIAAAAHRIGNMNSFPVDNCAKGGFTASIDLDTGEIGKATTTIDGSPMWHSIHPDTGNPIEGVHVPNWKRLTEDVLKIAEKFNYLPSVGWDIVLKEENKFYVLEGNNSPDLKLHQVHNPLLQNPMVVEFFKFHGIIRK